MKLNKIVISGFVLVFFSFLMAGSISAQEKKKKTEKVEIKSSVVCGMCETKIKKELAFEKGVKSVEVDLKKKIITVAYNTKKTDKEKIKKAITKIGYDADELLADEKAYGKLPACCKKDVAPH